MSEAVCHVQRAIQGGCITSELLCATISEPIWSLQPATHSGIEMG